MPREIIHVQVGQCGNQVGCAFFKALFLEHCISLKDGNYDAAEDKKRGGIGDIDGDGIPDVLENVDVYFRAKEPTKIKESHFTPRAVLVDLEPGTLDVIKSSQIGPHFKHDNMVFGANGAGNNWAKGHYTEGAELVEKCLDKIRQEIESAHAPQGFQLMHSLGGGTGSGMGTLLLLKIRDAYPDRITTTYSIYPSPKVSDTVVEPYNAVLSSHQLLENSDETFIVDNEALYNISNNVLKAKEPTYENLNGLIAQVTCGITASLRFSGSLNGDLRKLGVNLVPFPRLHFFLVSQAPLYSKEASQKANLRVSELVDQSYSERNFFANVRLQDGKSLAVAFVFRGSMKTKEVDEAMKKLQNKQGAESGGDFVEWIPNNIKSSVISEAPVTSDQSATFMANTTALKGIYQRLATQFGAMYKRKAFLHWYKGEGMDEMEFQEADKNVRDLITEYQDKQDAVYQEESGDEGSEDNSENI
jgi:tubulin beta